MKDIEEVKQLLKQIIKAYEHDENMDWSQDTPPEAQLEKIHPHFYIGGHKDEKSICEALLELIDSKDVK